MYRTRTVIPAALLVAASLLVAPLAEATTGNFKIGYGSKNRGVAGTGIALGQDTLAGSAALAQESQVGAASRCNDGFETGLGFWSIRGGMHEHEGTEPHREQRRR